MHIHQIDVNSRIFPEDIRGKWYCSEISELLHEDPIIRYLQQDGTWGLIARYFDTKEEIDVLLPAAGKPDFTMSMQERIDRADIRQMAAEAMDDSYWDYMDRL